MELDKMKEEIKFSINNPKMFEHISNANALKGLENLLIGFIVVYCVALVVCLLL